MLPFQSSTPHCVGLVPWHVGDVTLFGAIKLVSRVVHVVTASETVEEVVVFLYFFAKWLMLVELCWVLALLYSWLPLLVGWWCISTFPIMIICHVWARAKMFFPLLAIGIVVPPPILSPLACIGRADSSALTQALW